MTPGIPVKARPLGPPNERGRSRSRPRDAAAKAWPSQTARQWGVWGPPSVQPAGAAGAATTTRSTPTCAPACAGAVHARDRDHVKPAGAAGAASTTRATSAPPSQPDGKGKGQSKSKDKDKGPGKSKKGKGKDKSQGNKSSEDQPARAAGTARSAGYPGQPSSVWGFMGNAPPRPAAGPPRLDSPYLHEQLSAAALARGLTVDEYMRDWHHGMTESIRRQPGSGWSWPAD